VTRGPFSVLTYAPVMPRWGPSGQRHYKTTTVRRGNTTYRTTQSRGPWGGSYAPPTKAEAKFLKWFFGLLFGIAILFWPFYRLHGTALAIVGPIWVVVVWGGAVLLIRRRSKSKPRPVVDQSTKVSAASVAPRKTTTPPTDRSAQVGELERTVERLTREVDAAKNALGELRSKQEKSTGHT
jgi:HAMP domain-containing protein